MYGRRDQAHLGTAIDVEDLSTEAYVLRTRAYGESDVIAVLLTRDFGKLSAIAKGAKRSKRRFAGGVLEIFQHIGVRLARRPHSSLAFLHEALLIESHHRLAGDVTTFAWASYLCELTNAMTHDYDPCSDLFEFLGRCLGTMAGGETAAEGLAHHFVLGLLERAGWGPDFSVCGICDEPVDEASRPILDMRGSGVVCARHEAERRGLDPTSADYRPSRRIISAELLDYVRRARSQPVTDAGDALCGDATLLLDRLVSLHVRKPLQSRRFLAQIGAHP